MAMMIGEEENKQKIYKLKNSQNTFPYNARKSYLGNGAGDSPPLQDESRQGVQLLEFLQDVLGGAELLGAGLGRGTSDTPCCPGC